MSNGFLSNGKADKNHNPSFKSCLLRIPNSFNSKCLSKGESLENSKVNIIQKWNGYRPSIVASEILYFLRKKNLIIVFSINPELLLLGSSPNPGVNYSSDTISSILNIKKVN
jgi:hypothetical protein